MGNACFRLIEAPSVAWATWGTAVGFAVAVLFNGECDKAELWAGWGSVNDLETLIWGAAICFGGLVFTCWRMDGLRRET